MPYGVLQFTSKSRVQGTGVPFIEYKTNEKCTVHTKKEYNKDMWAKIGDNHQLMEIRFYCKGQKEGPQLAFWENGLKRFAFTAHEDGNEGSLEEWNREGHLFHLGHYLHGQEEGAQQLWYDNGKIRANYVIRQGKRYGLLGTKNCKNVSDSIFVVK